MRGEPKLQYCRSGRHLMSMFSRTDSRGFRFCVPCRNETQGRRRRDRYRNDESFRSMVRAINQEYRERLAVRNVRGTSPVVEPGEASSPDRSNPKESL